MNFALSLNQIETLNGSNFKKWKQDVELQLGLADFDHVLKEDPPAELTPQCSKEVRDKYNQWHRHNRLSLVIMKKSISEAVRGGIGDTEYAREYMKNIEDKFKLSEKAETGNLMGSLVNSKFDGIGSIKEYIMKCIDISAKFKDLNTPIAEDMLVYLVLNSLPEQYSQIYNNYITQKEKWTLNELISICVQAESKIKKGKSVATAVNLVSKPQFKKKFTYRPNGASTSNSSSASTSKAPQGSNNNQKNFKAGGVKCFFCRKPGHVKKDCKGFKDWLNKRGFNKKEDPKQG
ncbi:hypothetical protein ABKV19_017926 [Rosa sericea]